MRHTLVVGEGGGMGEKRTAYRILVGKLADKNKAWIV